MFQNINESTIDNQNYREKRKQKNRNTFKCIFNKKYTNICNIINDINGRNNRRFFTI